ncbi:hypothetical protein C1S70_25550 [Azospirillum argentinense]|uniref:Uncharacterized protein n=1 Tax=Azospirillum argentinense TaxID=2970906 RepID=A0A2K1FU97_9PROT|nr:hypothetical protein [Azospirillum argentinense]PNQ96115.1 hypothetical protein C1S70_25550 [Azospirillum argentinense]
MSTSINALFSATTASSTATATKWKPTGGATEAEGTWKAASDAGSSAGSAALAALKGEDSVELSGLAKSLTGVAGKVFASIGSKGRAMLEDFVKSGKMTEKDVALGLRQMATNAVKNRFLNERVPDEEDQAWSEKSLAANKAQKTQMDRMGKAMAAMNEVRTAAYAAYDKDQDSEAFMKRMAPANERFIAETADINREMMETAGGNPGDVMLQTINYFLKKGESEFSKLDFGAEAEGGEGGLLASRNAKGEAAANLMSTLGFTAKYYKNGLAEYAAGVDIPGIGRGQVDKSHPNPADFEPSAKEEAEAAGLPPPPTTVLTTSQTPGLQGFAKVIQDARDSLDATYTAMAKEGKGVNYSDPTGKDVERLFGGFDRRSLHAIASNKDGTFSKNEQEAAQSVMARQQKQAMDAADPLGTDKAAAYRAGVKFLDEASQEEKESVNWSVQRAALQYSYEKTMKETGAPMERLGNGSALASVLKDALEAQDAKTADVMKSVGGKVMGGEGTGYVSDLKSLSLFRDFLPNLSVRGAGGPMSVTV